PSGTPKEDLVPAIPTPPDEESVEPGLIGGPAPGGRTSVLVGYGPRQTEAKRRARKGAGSSAPAAAASPNAAAPTAALSSTAAPSRNAAAPAAAPSSAAAPAASAPAASAPAAAGDARVLAKPPVRKLAKDLGIDLCAIQPSGDGGIITRADVEAALSGGTGGSGANGGTSASGGTRGASGANGGAGGAASFGGRGMGGNGERETRVPVKSVRKATAEAMVRSAFTAPHVTEWVTVDVTRTMKLVERLRGMREFEGVRISPLALVARALILAVQRHPEINASWDEAAQEIVLKHYVNLGIAAATPRGLVVPNIKDAEQLSLPELAAAISELARTAREGKTPPSDMQGASISITNVGVFGVDAGTPILPPGEAAILCFGQVREMPWVHKGKVRPRQVTQLALSFDHRLVDGELGSKVLADVARILEDPGMALVLG
ncbi:MAG: dihydrolipoamide acetyltransferase family protein, partial [Actinomycetes bacterium]